MERLIISTLWDRGTRNDINANFKYLFNGVETMKKTISDLIIEAGQSDAEVIQARGGEELLNDRLDKFDDDLVTGGDDLNNAKTVLNEKIDNNKNEVDSKIQLINNTTSNSKDVFFSNLDFQKLLAVEERLEDGKGPQAGNVIGDKYYILRQNASPASQNQAIYEYDLNTQSFIRSVPIPITTSNRLYIEGMPYFTNNNGELNFIIPIDQYGEYGTFNFDTGDIDKSFQMDGTYKIGSDNNNKFILVMGNENKDFPSSPIDFIKLYDFDSVVSGTPQLVKKIDLYNKELWSEEKVQSLTMIDDTIFLGRGEADIIITAIDTKGNLLFDVSHDKKELLQLMNMSDASNIDMECEGLFWITENNTTSLVLVNCVRGSVAKIALVKMGDITGSRIKRTLVPGVNSLASTFKLTRSSGSPTIDLSSGSDDFYEVVENITEPGLYSFYIHSTVKNNPLGKSLRGIVQVTHTEEGYNSGSSIIGQDYDGNFTNGYYSTAGWREWRVNGQIEKFLTGSINDMSGAVALNDSLKNYKKIIICTGNVGNGSLFHSEARGWYTSGFRVGDPINAITNSSVFRAEITKENEITILETNNALRYIIGIG